MRHAISLLVIYSVCEIDLMREEGGLGGGDGDNGGLEQCHSDPTWIKRHHVRMRIQKDFNGRGLRHHLGDVRKRRSNYAFLVEVHIT